MKRTASILAAALLAIAMAGPSFAASKKPTHTKTASHMTMKKKSSASHKKMAMAHSKKTTTSHSKKTSKPAKTAKKSEKK